MKQIVIGIDYDDTITLDIDKWKEIIKFMSNLGFIIYIVTYRESTQFKDMDLNIEGVTDYLFTNANGKRKYCEDCGIEIDIWIEDTPESILFDYKGLLKNLEIK